MIPPLIENFGNFKYPTELGYSYGRDAMTAMLYGLAQ